MREAFRKFSVVCSDAMGSAWAFVLAALVIVMWGASGPLFGFSDTWQLVINTGTTILTFLAVFLIQNTQNRDAKAIHLKLDELIRAAQGARNGLMNLEELPDDEIKKVSDEFHKLHEEVHEVADEAEDAKDAEKEATKARRSTPARTQATASRETRAKATNGSRRG